MKETFKKLIVNFQEWTFGSNEILLYLIENEKTLAREIDALREGMKYFKLSKASKAYLVTEQREEVVEVEEGAVEIVPMWKWLLM